MLTCHCYHGNSFTVDDTTEDESYTYTFKLCADAGGIPGAGVIQVNKKEKKPTIVGRYNSTQAIGGSKFGIFTSFNHFYHESAFILAFLILEC